MKASISEHDSKLELNIDCESYEEHMLLNAFLREHKFAFEGSEVLPISDHKGGVHWSITLGSCECEARARGRKSNCPYEGHGDDCDCGGSGGDR